MNPGAETYNLVLTRPGTGTSWGFRLQGGADFATPLSIQMVNPGSVAEQAGVRAGDAVLAINNRPSDEINHEDAKREILMAGNQVQLLVQRGAVTIWKPQVTNLQDLKTGSTAPGAQEDPYPYIQKTSLAAQHQPVQHIGSGHNRSARPFPGFGGGSSTGGGGGGPSPFQPPPSAPQNPPSASQYQYGGSYDANTSGSVAGVGGTYQSSSQPQEPAPGQSGGMFNPTASTEARTAGTRSVRAPVTKLSGERKEAQYMTCNKCGALIVGIFVKIQGEPIHPECFKCAACGCSLKNKGHFTIAGQLLCEVHAREAGPGNR